MCRRMVGWGLVLAVLMGLCGPAMAEDERISGMEEYLEGCGCRGEELRFTMDVFEAAMVEDGVDVNVVVDRMLADLTAAENAWIGILNMVRLEDQEEAYWTKLMERQHEFPVGSFYYGQIESEIEDQRAAADLEAVRAWLATQGIDFPESVRFDVKEGEMLKILDVLQGLPEDELRSWYPRVYAAIDKRFGAQKFFREVVPVLIADKSYSPALRSLLLPTYMTMLDAMVRSNTKFYSDWERAQPILEGLNRAAHPDFAADYEALAGALAALDASDLELIYDQLGRIISLMDCDYAELLDAYAGRDDAQSGAPMHDLLMAERESKLQRSFWTPADLRLFYKAAFPEDGLPRYAPANPRENHVLCICPEKSGDDMEALMEALHGTGLIPTGDPDEAEFALVYELAHGRGGDYHGDGRFIAVQSTTATLRLADWSREPKEHAGISATNQPGDVISVRQGAVTYAVPAPDLRTAEGWKEFVKKAKDAVH